MWRRYVCCMMIMLLFTACGSKNDTDAQAGKTTQKEVAVTSGNEAARVETPVESSPPISLPCGGMTNAAAAEILGVTVEQIQYSFSEILNTCSYRVDMTTSVSYVVYAETDAATAEAEMTKVTDGLKILVACESVPDVGDAAVFCHGDRAERLLVRKGSVWVDVLTPNGLDLKKRVAQHVLK